MSLEPDLLNESRQVTVKRSEQSHGRLQGYLQYGNAIRIFFAYVYVCGVCVGVCSTVWTHISMYVCMYTCRGLKLTSEVFPNCSLLCLMMEEGLLLNPEFTSYS